MVNAGSGDGGSSQPSSSDYGASDYVDGRRVRWAALASLFVGAPMYAYLLGFLGFLGDIDRAITRALDGVASFFEGLITATFASGAAAIDLSWWSFWLAARSVFGPFAWHATLVATFLTLYLLQMGVRRVVG